LWFNLLKQHWGVQYWQIISIFSFLISVTRQLVVNETRNCLVTDILLNIRKSAEWIKNGKTQLFNSEGVVKWGYFQKKWSIPLMSKSLWFNQFIEMADSFKERSIWSDLICSYTNQCIHSKLIHSKETPPCVANFIFKCYFRCSCLLHLYKINITFLIMLIFGEKLHSWDIY